MKKIALIVALCMCNVISGCAPADKPQQSNATDVPTITPIVTPTETPSPQPTHPPALFTIELTDLPREYLPEEAKANGDYVNVGLGKYANEDKMTAFIDAIHAKETGAVRITRYSDEGNPDIADVVFDGSKFTVWIDTTRDQYGVKSLYARVYLYMKEYEYDGRTSLLLTNEAELG